MTKKAKHTPRLWSVQYRGWGPEDGYIVVDSSGKPVVDDEVNTRLKAAAPDGYELIREAVDKAITDDWLKRAAALPRQSRGPVTITVVSEVCNL